MINSDLNGQHVNYKDSVGFKHTGVIVGMSEDKQWVHVKSDKPTAPTADWHFRIRAGEIEKYLGVKNA